MERLRRTLRTAALPRALLLPLTLLLVARAATEDHHHHPWDLGAGRSDGSAVASRQMATDPDAVKDTFRDLTDNDLAKLSRYSPHWRRELMDSHLTVGVEVVLVGFAGDGRGRVQLDEAELANFLRSLHTETEWRDPGGTRQKGTAGSGSSKSGGSRGLPIQFFFRVRHGNQRLLKDAASAVTSATEAAPEGAQAVLVPRSSVDSVVARDAKTAELSYSLYILNLPAAPKPHLYTYGDGGCPGTVWVSSERYAWVDISAGPVEHGPPATIGSVTGLTFPNMTSNSIVRARSGSSRQGQQSGSAALELVPLVHSMCKHLLARPSVRPPAWHSQHGTRVVVVRMTDAMDDPREAAGQRGTEGEYLEVLRRELQKLQLGPAAVTVEQVELPFRDCSRCVAAYTRALRSDLVLGEDGEPATRFYLDLAELKQWLNPLLEDGGLSYTASEKKAKERLEGGPGDAAVVALYLFDLSIPEVLLLDGESQAAPLDHHAAVAVRTRFSEQAAASELGVESSFECQGRPVRLDPGSLSRPLLAAVLQAAWGLHETDEEIDPFSGHKRRDYRWSVGQDLFTPLSQAATLSFSHRDAALHNVVLPRLLSVRDYLLDALDVLQSLAAPQRHLPGRYLLSVVTQDRRAVFVQRTNFLMHKYTRALKMLSANRIEEANYYVTSMLQHDTKAHLLEMDAVKETVRSSLVCSHGSPEGEQEWLLWLAGLGLLLCAIGVYIYSRLSGRMSSDELQHFKAF